MGLTQSFVWNVSFSRQSQLLLHVRASGRVENPPKPWPISRISGRRNRGRLTDVTVDGTDPYRYGFLKAEEKRGTQRNCSEELAVKVLWVIRVIVVIDDLRLGKYFPLPPEVTHIPSPLRAINRKPSAPRRCRSD